MMPNLRVTLEGVKLWTLLTRCQAKDSGVVLNRFSSSQPADFKRHSPEMALSCTSLLRLFLRLFLRVFLRVFLRLFLRVFLRLNLLLVACTTLPQAHAQGNPSPGSSALNAGACLGPVLTKCEVLQRQTAEQITECLQQTILKSTAAPGREEAACQTYERSEVIKPSIGNSPNTGLLACIRDVDKLELSHRLPSPELVSKLKVKTASISATCRKTLDFAELEVAKTIGHAAPRAKMKPKTK
jgi:hypothetical protein